MRAGLSGVVMGKEEVHCCTDYASEPVCLADKCSNYCSGGTGNTGTCKGGECKIRDHKHVCHCLC